MNTFLYTLEKYTGPNSRYTCPNCGRKKVFSRYINTESNEYLDDNVGRCSREDKCTYHYTPKQYFIDNPFFVENERCLLQNTKEKQQATTCNTVYFIPEEVLNGTRKDYSLNLFVQNLIQKVQYAELAKLINTYRLGTISGGYMRGAVTFPYIDALGRCRAIQAKLFDKDNHTTHTNHLHALLKSYLVKQGQPVPMWLEYYYKNEQFYSCLFGEHLLKEFPDKPCAVVEAPKTALIASLYLPQFLWLAIGSKSYLTPDRMKALHGRQVALWPDVGAYIDWKKKAGEMKDMFQSIQVSDLLETRATPIEREKGYDLADYLIQFPITDFIQPEPEPTEEDLMHQFDTWLQSNPAGGIFTYAGGRLMVKAREEHAVKTES